jgi:hypothetical protein
MIEIDVAMLILRVWAGVVMITVEVSLPRVFVAFADHGDPVTGTSNGRDNIDRVGRCLRHTCVGVSSDDVRHADDHDREARCDAE